MLSSRRHWTLLTALIAIIAYVVRNYDIQGLDGIRIEPRDPTAQVEPFPLPTEFPDPLVVLPKFPNTVPAGNSNPRTNPIPSPLPSSLPSALPNMLPGALPSALPSTAPSTLPGASPSSNPSSSVPRISVSPPPGRPASSFPSQLPGQSANSSPNISLGERLAILEESQSPGSHGPSSGNFSSPPAGQPRDGKSIRVGTFNAQVFGPAKRAKPHVMEIFVKLLRQFEVVALQEICSNQDDLLPELVDRLNQSGKRFDYLIGPRVGRGASREQFAFLFDAERIETDRFQLYTVDDPQDLLFYEPLVGWFRTKGLTPGEAFTFSLVNVHSHPDFAAQENQSLPELVRAIERDGRGEDDWILAGDFGAGDSQLSYLHAAGARFALLGVPTDVRGLRMFDNLIFSNQATREFTGRAGVVDFLRLFNLSLEQALEVSDHLPAWAEFTIHEGGLPGRVAPQVAPIIAPPDPTASLPAILPPTKFDAR